MDYKFLGVDYLLPFQNLAAYFSTFKVTMETALLSLSLTSIKDEMLFGEVQQGILKIRNNTSVAVSEAIIYSQDPLFTGFRLKRLGRIEANTEISHQISLRATMINAQELCFTLFYKSEIEKPEGRVVTPNLWRVAPFYVGMQIKSSFTLKCHNETIAENQRLICIDTLSKISA